MAGPGPVSSWSLGGTIHPVMLALACARPVHHSAPMAIYGSDSRTGPYDTDTAMTVHFTMSATAKNGATSSAMCFMPMARKIPVVASTR